MRCLVPGFLWLIASASYASAQTWSATEKWNLRIEPASCTLGREMSDGSDALLVSFIIKPVARTGQLLLGAPPRLAGQLTGPVTLKGPNALNYTGTVRPAGKTSAGLVVTALYVDHAEMLTLVAGSNLTIETKGLSITLPISGSAATKGALEGCERDIIRRWNIDPAEVIYAAPAQAPNGSASRDSATARPAEAIASGRWLTAEDYPVDAMRAREQGTVELIWRVDNEGRTGDCRIVATSKSKSLDARSCEIILKRGRYRPAIDATGKAVPSWDRTEMNWLLPGGR